MKALFTLLFIASSFAHAAPTPTPTPRPLATPTVSEWSKAKAFEKKGQIWALSEVTIVGQRDSAQAAALRAAAAKAAALLEQKDSARRERLAESLFNAVQKDSTLADYDLGPARLESVMQERWEAPDGKEAWSVKLKFSVRRK